MRSTHAIGCILVAVAARQARAEHHGFTAAIDVGGGTTYVASDAFADQHATEYGPGWGVLVGGFVRPDLAIAFHGYGQWAPVAFDDRLAKTGGSAMFGAVAQYWPNERWSVTGGVGYGVAAYQLRDPNSIDEALGVGNGGFAPLVGTAYVPAYGVRISLELGAIIASDGFEGVISSLGIGWQYLH